MVLIDGDLRRPQLHKKFDIGNEHGLSNLLSGGITIEPYLQETPIETLKVLTSGSQPTLNPSVLLGSEMMRNVLEQVKATADVVLVDSPPILYPSDALELASVVDQVLLVIWSGMLRRGTVTRPQEALAMVKTKQVDVVLNKVRRDVDSYAYYSYYYREKYYAKERD